MSINQNGLVYNPALQLWVPRVTHILRVHDKGYGYHRWYALEAAKRGIEAGRAIAFDEELDLDNRAKACVDAVDQYVADTADFGTEVHRWLADWNRGNEYEPSERIAACVKPWPTWFDKHVAEVFTSEWQVFGDLGGLHYEGTLDLIAKLLAGTKLGHGGRTLDEDTWAVIDFKTGGEYYDDWGYQVAAYNYAIYQMARCAQPLDWPLPSIRLIIRLDREKPGKVYCKECADYENDLGIFRDCLSIWYRQNTRSLAKFVDTSILEGEITKQEETKCPSDSPP